jgi:hypothetical protein
LAPRFFSVEKGHNPPAARRHRGLLEEERPLEHCFDGNCGGFWKRANNRESRFQISEKINYNECPLFWEWAFGIQVGNAEIGDMPSNSINIWKIKGKEGRITLEIPVAIEGEDAASAAFNQTAFTENVSRHGACILVDRDLKVGSTLKISAFRGKFQNQAMVMSIWIDDQDQKRRAGLRFTEPIRNWVVN